MGFPLKKKHENLDHLQISSLDVFLGAIILPKIFVIKNILGIYKNV